MLDRIEDLVETNRQVSDNVAHDVQTQLRECEDDRRGHIIGNSMSVSTMA
jgi:hypothetical protein